MEEFSRAMKATGTQIPECCEMTFGILQWPVVLMVRVFNSIANYDLLWCIIRQEHGTQGNSGASLKDLITTLSNSQI